ncbi:hypothetical protein L7F22_010958 [Adiantum nelumboides]|nr:hypothetical protein [Adiantum nelumboides]
MLAMASSSRGRNKKLVYKVKSSRASDGSVVYSCIFSCLDDVEHHRHRRNPFDPKYIQAALSSFDELGRDSTHRVATREEVEAASTSVHVRIELIKSMKDGLVKLTNEAVKHCKVNSKKAPKHKPSLEENKDCVFEAMVPQQNSQPCNFLEDEIINVYQRKFGQAFVALQDAREAPCSLVQNDNTSTLLGSINLELAQVIDDLDSCLNGNANFLSEDELSFNINKETTEALHDVLQRTQSVSNSALHCEDDLADLSAFKGFISPITKDLILDFETSHQSSENIEERTSQHDETETNDCTEGCLKWDSEVSLEVSDGGSPTTTISECVVSTKLHHMQSAVPLDKPLDSSEVMQSLEPVNVSDFSAASSESDDISSPSEYHPESMEVCSTDEMMEDISIEEAEDDIEDGEDIEKFLALRKQLRKSKSSWLVQDPEKLLLPPCIQLYVEPKDEDIESGKIFGQALSREGSDLIVHFNLLQQGPSKVYVYLCTSWDFNTVKECKLKKFCYLFLSYGDGGRDSVGLAGWCRITAAVLVLTDEQGAGGNGQQLQDWWLKVLALGSRHCVCVCVCRDACPRDEEGGACRICWHGGSATVVVCLVDDENEQQADHHDNGKQVDSRGTSSMNVEHTLTCFSDEDKFVLLSKMTRYVHPKQVESRVSRTAPKLDIFCTFDLVTGDLEGR